MRGLQPALCAWLSQAAALLDGQQVLAARVISACARGPDSGPELREALAAAVWVQQRLQTELQARITELFGAPTSPDPTLAAWFDAAPATQQDGPAACAAAARATADAWREALPVVDAHTRLLLSLQLAQLDRVVLPALQAGCAPATRPPAAEPLRQVLADHLPPAPGHPEAFLAPLG